MRAPNAILSLLWIGACSWIDQETYDARRDTDGDGVAGDVDCNDNDADVGLPVTWYRDGDGDGAGAPLDTTEACRRPEGFVAEGTDCDDSTPDVGPEALEVCSGRDDDCDGLVDDLDPSLSGDVPRWLPDADDDGYPASFDAVGVVLVASCLAPEGHLPVPDVPEGYDCDDTNALQLPGGTEQCDGLDNDCNGQVDEATDPEDPAAVASLLDADADGWPPVPGEAGLEVTYACSVPPGRTSLEAYDALVEWAAQVGRDVVYDCDDTDDELAPDVFDVPYDGVDADCQGNDDFDFDGDGFAAEGEGGTDCDDTDALVNTDAPETCATPYDDNCDDDVGTPDVEDAALFLMRDEDNDGWPADEAQIPRCALEAGWTDLVSYEQLLQTSGLAGDPDAVVLDCDDEDPNRYPSAVDAPYNGRDEDCQEDSDYDFDGDGEDSAFDVAGGTDCDDQNPQIAAGLPELCATPFDDNCDGITNVPDELGGDEVMVLPDADGDGWPESTNPVARCAVTSGFVLEADYQVRVDALLADRPGLAVLVDCADGDPTRHPGQPDTPYDGFDADCQEDDDYDVDGDGARSAAETEDGTDCDDGNAAVNPSAEELCATVGVDDDCDGVADERGTSDGTSYFVDEDRDGYAVDPSRTAVACTDEDTLLTTAELLGFGDCDDTSASRYPSAPEVPDDGIDQDCNASDTVTCYLDDDGDGVAGTLPELDPEGTCAGEALFVSPGADCDDADPAISPLAPEWCDAIDNNCDGVYAPALTGFPVDPTAPPVDLALVSEIPLADYERVAVCGGTWDVAFSLAGTSDEAPGVVVAIPEGNDRGVSVPLDRPVFRASDGTAFRGTSATGSLLMSGVSWRTTSPGVRFDLSDLGETVLADVDYQGSDVGLTVGGEDATVSLESVTVVNTGAATSDALVVLGDADATDVVLEGGGLQVNEGALSADGISIFDAGTAVTVATSGQATLRDVEIVDSQAAAAVQGSLTLVDGWVAGNGGHIGVAPFASLFATNVAFSDNLDTFGGAVRGEVDSVVVLSEGSFVGNEATYGGGVMLQGLSALLNNTFKSNRGVYGGGAWLEGSVTLRGSSFSGHREAVAGGGLHIGDSGLMAAEGEPNALVTTVQLTKTSLSSNDGLAGGCMAAYDAVVSFVSGDTSACEAIDQGGMVYVGDGASVQLQSVSVAEHVARLGGGAFVDAAGALEVCGGVWSDNSASEGGALYVGGDVALGDATFDTNLASRAPLAHVDVGGELAIGNASQCLGTTPTTTGHKNPSVVVAAGGLLSGVGWIMPGLLEEWLDEATLKTSLLP